MNDVSYDIQVERERDLVLMSLAGFFGPSDVEGFRALRRLAFAQLRCPPNQHVTLLDLRRLQVQSREAVQEFQAVLAEPGFVARRLAVLVESALGRLQVMRLLDARDAQCFTDPVEAREWLLRER